MPGVKALAVLNVPPVFVPGHGVPRASVATGLRACRVGRRRPASYARRLAMNVTAGVDDVAPEMTQRVGAMSELRARRASHSAMRVSFRNSDSSSGRERVAASAAADGVGRAIVGTRSQIRWMSTSCPDPAEMVGTLHAATARATRLVVETRPRGSSRAPPPASDDDDYPLHPIGLHGRSRAVESAGAPSPCTFAGTSTRANVGRALLRDGDDVVQCGAVRARDHAAMTRGKRGSSRFSLRGEQQSSRLRAAPALPYEGFAPQPVNPRLRSCVIETLHLAAVSDRR